MTWIFCAALQVVRNRAKALGVSINTYKVIYNLIDDVRAAMEGKLRTIEEKIPLGTAEVKVSGVRVSRVSVCFRFALHFACLGAAGIAGLRKPFSCSCSFSWGT